MTTTVDQKVRRGNCFKLLAACFYEPEKEFFLKEGLCDNLASQLASLHLERAATAANGMKQALEEQNDSDLKVEYARLFVGPFKLIAPPYGSVYLEGKRMLMGDSTLAVQKAYQENGLALEVSEAPDHIALELEFMHYLCLREANAEAGQNKEEAGRIAGARSEFIGKFLKPWVANFCTDIRTGTDNQFYRHLADCLEGFIAKAASRHETDFLKGQPEKSHVCRISA
jgi:putative dimethyl sulfoxide reductase chaperone